MIDNDSAIYEAICDSMQDDLIEVCCITSSAEALASYMKRDYCLVILDIQLADMDGMELLHTMRQMKHTPILALTVPLNAEEIVDILHAGADTYLEQPLNIEICAAQANALMQLYLDADMNHDHHRPIVHGSGLIISPRYRRVIVDGKPVELTRKEFDLLHYLASYPEQVFSSNQLYRQVWNEEPSESGNDTVKVHIGNLRKKISDIGRECIHTVWGVGYKFSIEPQSDAMG